MRRKFTIAAAGDYASSDAFPPSSVLLSPTLQDSVSIGAFSTPRMARPVISVLRKLLRRGLVSPPPTRYDKHRKEYRNRNFTRRQLDSFGNNQFIWRKIRAEFILRANSDVCTSRSPPGGVDFADCLETGREMGNRIV